MKRTCTDCNGTGKTFDFLAYLFDPRTWIPFSINYRPWTPCRSCNGRGYWHQKWREWPNRKWR